MQHRKSSRDRFMGREMMIFSSIQWILIVSGFLVSLIVFMMLYKFYRKNSNYILDIHEKNLKLMDATHQMAATEQQLRALNQQLMASEQQLRAANLQLAVSEEEARAANQQLMAGEQQLRASNQQLMANEQQLRAANQQLMASEQALRESESRYSSLFNDMAEGVALHRIIYDDNSSPVDYEIINVNPQYEAILNISREQVLNKLATEAYGVEEPPFISEYSKVAETGIPYRFETYFPPLKKYFEISASSFSKGYFATIFSDITYRKHVEEEKLKFQTQIQKLESMGILAGGIAHDFNNLLTGILANINLVAIQMKDDEKISKRLSAAENACLRSQDLTKQLLTFSSGGAPVKSIIDLKAIIRDSVYFTTRGSNVTPEFNFTDDLRAVEVDKGQISQVISNLSINAIHAMPNGGIIKLSADNINVSKDNGLPIKSGPYVKISVEDSGIGIPEEYFQKIFDPYFSTKKQGSGLGLAISHSIISKHDGFITAESRPEKGTIFHIYIPTSTQEAPPEVSVDDNIEAGKGNILFMDDEEMVTTTAKAILNEFGFDVSLAGDGKEAIELYQKMKDSGNPFDLVIMDLTVQGGMGGKEAIEKLLKIDPNAKAIVSSGYSSSPVMADFRSHGFKGVITKPYKVHELVNTIKRVLET